jgi:dCMP deaminase
MSDTPNSADNATMPAPDWNEYFLGIAEAAKMKSKDPKCKVGAVIVSRDNVVLSTGFNGLARGVADDEILLGDVNEKLKVICHAEANAILNAARMGVALDGTAIYVNKFPCLACCNFIIQAGIKRIYTHDNRYWTKDPFDPENIRKPLLLQQAGVKVDAPNHPDFSLSARLAKTAPERKGPTRSIEAVPTTEALPAEKRSGTG